MAGHEKEGQENYQRKILNDFARDHPPTGLEVCPFDRRFDCGIFPHVSYVPTVISRILRLFKSLLPSPILAAAAIYPIDSGLRSKSVVA